MLSKIVDYIHTTRACPSLSPSSFIMHAHPYDDLLEDDEDRVMSLGHEAIDLASEKKLSAETTFSRFG